MLKVERRSESWPLIRNNPFIVVLIILNILKSLNNTNNHFILCNSNLTEAALTVDCTDACRMMMTMSRRRQAKASTVAVAAPLARRNASPKKDLGYVCMVLCF